MKHELIKTEKYLLFVSNEKVEEGNFIYETKIGEVDCSVRLWGKIRDYFYDELGVGWHEIRVSDQSKISLSKFSKRRNAGKGTIEELQELCFYGGVTLQP